MKVVVTGASGRMGQTLIKLILEADDMRLHGAADRKASSVLGQDCGALVGLPKSGTAVSDDLVSMVLEAEGIIDFTLPGALAFHAEMAAQARIPLVVGTTGLGTAEMQCLEAAAAHAPIVQSGNMSLGVNLLAGLVEKAAAALGPEFDIEVLEMHHRHKVDAPSGTALLLGEAAAAGRKIDLQKSAVFAREGVTGPREKGSLGFATLRGGSVIGEHEVIFAGEGERLVLGHFAGDRAIFARGALQALRWAAGKKPGLYSMKDVLGL